MTDKLYENDIEMYAVHLKLVLIYRNTRITAVDDVSPVTI